MIAAACYYKFAPEVTKGVIDDCDSEEEIKFVKKTGPAVLSFVYLFWPVIFIFVILVMICVLIKRN